MEFDFPGYSLRPATPEDGPYFTVCVAESLLASVDDFEFEHADKWMPTAASMSEIYLNSEYMENELHILESEDGRAGMLWIGRTSEQFTCEDTGYILGIYVEPKLRGRGLAKAMIAAAESWAKAEGCMHLSINCGTFNEPAMSLYDSAGYSKRSVVFRKDLHP